MALFTVPQPSSPRQRSASRSTDDRPSTIDTPHRLPQRYVRDLSISSHSLATTSSHHNDLSPPYAPHTSSAQSTPMTSPSTAYSNPFPGSLSSATSDSIPSAESKYRSEFGLLAHGSSAHSPLHGSASSRSSHPVTPWSPSTTESDPQVSPSHIPRKRPSPPFSRRPSTAPHTPSVLATASSTGSPAEHHTRSHSRLTVSIKNLFFKSAIPSPSRFSFNSIRSTPSGSEACPPLFHAPVAGGKSFTTPRKSRPPDLEISGSLSSAMPSPSHTPNTPMDVHRRNASEAVTKMYNSKASSGLPTSQENLDVLAQNVPPSPVHVTKTRNVLRRRPSGSAKLVKGRDRSMSSPSQPREGDPERPRLPPKEYTSRQGGAPFPLTAAGAVVQAYKQQDLYRDDISSLPKLSIDDRMSLTASHEGAYNQDHLEHSPTPYYTVFGSSSRIQAGGPDDLWTKSEVDQSSWNVPRPPSSHQHSGSDSGGVGRSITRKVSMRWRKGKGGDEDSPLRHRDHSKEQQELSNVRSAAQSMDGLSNVRDDAWTSQITSHVQSGSEKGDESESGKLWRLMRRISTGGLRERFQSSKVVPPVPAIPKELLDKVNHSKRSVEILSSRKPSSSLYNKELTRTTTAPENMFAARPSIATASSSADSSNVASPQFFHKIHSSGSSVSSYGEAMVSRTPEPMHRRHIITPLEQLRLGDDHVQSGEPGTTTACVSRSPRRSTSVPSGLRTVESGGAQIPLPSPRRETCSGESSLSSRPSSTSAPGSGSTSASSQSQAVGLGQLRMVDGTVPLSPPPRPPKSSKRGGSGSITSSPSHSIVTKQADGGVGIADVRQIDRMPSGRSDLTARPESSESGRSQRQDRDRNGHPHTPAQLTFRELVAPRRPPLSEREKADIWNDLLARSDKAGGTLHINGATELLSDSLRFSTHSEV